MKSYGRWIWLTGITFTMIMSTYAKTSLARHTDNDHAYPDLSSPVGYWLTIDEKTQHAQSVMRITEAPDHTLVGQIAKAYPDPDHPPLLACTACRDERKNQPILGLVIMKKFKPDSHNPLKWSHGEILDPSTGKTYQCYVEVIDGGRRLKVRGYIGISLLGRTQYWLRQPNIHAKAGHA